MNTEQEMRLQFLDEAEEYIDTIEMGILSFDPNADRQNWDAVLRAAHSIKGGAAMMGYAALSEMAHRLEDFFKILKVNRGESLTRQVEADLLQGLDCSRRGMALYRRGETIDPPWLAENFAPVVDRLQDSLGELNEAIESELFAADTGEDMAVFFFQTEVESCLERLEGILTESDTAIVREEFRVAAQELGGLGEMLELPNFSSLCAEIEAHLALVNERNVVALARLALQELNRSRALVLVGQAAALPARFSIPSSVAGGSVREGSDFDTFIEGLDEAIDLDDFNVGDLDFLDAIPEEVSEIPEPAAIPLDIPDEEDTADNITKSEEAPAFQAGVSLTRVPTRKLQQLSDLIGELTLDRERLNLQLSSVRNLFALLGQRVDVLGRANRSLRDFYDRDREEMRDRRLGGLETNSPFDRLEMDRYSDIHSLLQELMETIARIQEVSGDIDTELDNCRRSGQQITRTSRTLQSDVIRVRLRPFSDLVGRFPRMVRDLSAKYGKEVHLSIAGSDVLLDRAVIDALSDPLLQLLRNAFDHGIEDADTRESRGKSRVGRIEITAAYRGDRAIVTLRDDGGGIDTEKIANRALQMGFTPEDVAKLTVKDLLSLIFEPGFSTAPEVTELSGRGIGMDIARARVAELRGRIDIDTRPGAGTAFTITVPFTLSVLRVLLVQGGGLFLAFPTDTIEEIIVPTPENRRAIDGKPFLDLDGDLVPLYRLEEYFHFARPVPDSETALAPIIDRPLVLLAARDDRLVAFEVSAYFGEQEVTARAVDGGFPLPLGFERCTTLGDGRVVPIVSAGALAEAIGRESPRNSRYSPDPLPVPIATKDLVLVVDDSINARRFLAVTLEKAGYRVHQAKDGRDALEQLEKGLPARAVICDIEMPRLDGYGFLAGVRPRWRDLPIFMLTSRSGDKHRRLALDLGASGYFSKPFQDAELLGALKEALSFPVGSVGSGENLVEKWGVGSGE
jgi:chemosensory pili system protein ChpA (sensor histidine kinase/response regulator)